MGAREESRFNKPPKAERRPVVEYFHDTAVVDEYRWLEDGESPETRAWVEGQNLATRQTLDHLAVRDSLRGHLSELLEIGMISAPVEAGGHLFYLHRTSENQPRLMVALAVPHSPSDGHVDCSAASAFADTVLIDPNMLDPSGLTTINWWYPSPYGRLIVYGISTSGDENSTLHIVDVDSGRLLSDEIEGARHSTIGWLTDSSGFYYTRIASGYPPAATGSSYYHRAVYLHHVGVDPEKDPEILPDDNDPHTQPAVSISRNGRWLIIGVHRGWDQVHLFIRDLSTDDSSFRKITGLLSALFDIDITGDTLYIRTNLHAPRYRLMRVDLEQLMQVVAAAGTVDTSEHVLPLLSLWAEVVPEREAVLDAFRLTRDGIGLHYLENAESHLVVTSRDGADRRHLELPEHGSMTELSGQEASSRLFVAFSSFTVPLTVFEHDMNIDTTRVWQKLDVDLGAERFRTEQHWFSSKDGTKVSMFVVSPRTEEGKPLPTILTGYGGFNISRPPAFTATYITWRVSTSTLRRSRGRAAWARWP